MTEYFSVRSSELNQKRIEGNLSTFWFSIWYQKSELPTTIIMVWSINLPLGFVDCHFEVSDRKTICYLHYTHTIIMAFSCNSCQSHQVAEKPIVASQSFPFLTTLNKQLYQNFSKVTKKKNISKNLQTFQFCVHWQKRVCLKGFSGKYHRLLWLLQHCANS